MSHHWGYTEENGKLIAINVFVYKRKMKDAQRLLRMRIRVFLSYKTEYRNRNLFSILLFLN